MNTNSVGWFEIYVADMERAKKFYEAVFSVKLQQIPNQQTNHKIEMYAFPGEMNRYGSPGAIVHIPHMPLKQGNSVLVYFSCQDCAVEEAKVVEHGGKVEKSKFSIGPYGDIALVYDCDGNMLGLHNPPANKMR